MGRFIGGLVLGLIAGLLGVISHAGPVDQPVIGLAVATALVVTGSWLSIRLAGVQGWLGYLVVATAVTAWMIFFPSHGDNFMSVTGWATEAWLILMALAIVVPMGIISAKTKRSRLSQND